jgi:hypothetical protein
VTKTKSKSTLPSVDQALAHLNDVEREYPYELRTAMTKKAVEANERFVTDRSTLEKFLGHLRSKDMFLPMYGLGHAPSGAPMALPPYLMEIMDASSRVLCALMRRNLRGRGPQYLIERMPQGWLTDEMAERLHAYFLETEPDMGFDVLVYGKHSYRGMTFEEFKRSGDMLDAKILEAQSVDTYFGWVREYIRGARLAGLTDGCQFTWARSADGRLLTDTELDEQVKRTLNHGFDGEPESILFLEIEPEKQASGQNLVFMADLMSGGDPHHRPAILDPRDLAIRDRRLYVTKHGEEREIKKVISRIVDVDLQAFLHGREADGDSATVERLKQMFALPHLFADLSKHLAGFYLIDKSSLTDMSLLGDVSIAPRTELITDAHLERYRLNPGLLKNIAIKPLHGMSAKGVVVQPTLEQVERAAAAERMLAQETFWATPLQPDMNPDIPDPDVHAGICCEARLVLQAGSPAVPHEPHRARLIAGISRSHFQSRDPDRKIKNDPRGRGWYSNVGAIMAVRKELGISEKDDGGVGMAPIYCPW